VVCAGGYEQLLRWGSFEVDQLNTLPQKLLNEFSLAYMVADFIFFLLPFTPDGGHTHAPRLPACSAWLRLPLLLPSLQVSRWTEVFRRARPTHCCSAAADYVFMIHHSISVVYLVGWGPLACWCITLSGGRMLAPWISERRSRGTT
jgi:hypothetical protein